MAIVIVRSQVREEVEATSDVGELDFEEARLAPHRNNAPKGATNIGNFCRSVPSGRVLRARGAVEVDLVSDLQIQRLSCDGGPGVHGAAQAGTRRAFHHGLYTDFSKAVRVLDEAGGRSRRCIGVCPPG